MTLLHFADLAQHINIEKQQTNKQAQAYPCTIPEWKPKCSAIDSWEEQKTPTNIKPGPFI